jgi:hypothetical protein
MDGSKPARVPDPVIDEIRSRERGGLVELPKPPASRPGDPVRVLRGPFADHLALYVGMKPRERVEVLLALLGGQQRVTLGAGRGVMSRRRRDHAVGRRLARRAYHRQGGLCFWCKRPMLPADYAGATSEADPRLMTAEHVQPV